MSKGFLEAPLGTLEITAENGKITGIGLVKEESENAAEIRSAEKYAAEQDRLIIEKAKLQLLQYFDGTRRNFDLEIGLHGTDFQKKVWQVLLTIPYGQTMSYAETAEAAGTPKAQRAAGSAIGKNPLLIVIPCHRVIRSDGSLGGFGAGIENKIFLHRIEGIEDKR